MSSGDSILHSAASIGVRDGLSRLIPGGLEDHKERTAIRILVVVLSVVAWYFAVASDISLVALLLAAYGGVAQIFPLMFAAFYWPRANGTGALAGLVAGISVNVFFMLHPEHSPIPGVHEGLWGLAANLLVFVVVSLLTKAPEEARVREFVEV
jgi:SSS family solute:Na+ symporter